MSSWRGGVDGEPMARVDTAWLRMERPTNLMMITGVLMFAGRLDHARLTRLIAERFLDYRRFRERAVDAETGARWQDDPGLDLDWHVQRVAIPAPCGPDQLQALVSRLASTPLDPARPRWQFHLVERCGAGSALVCRIHHCYADGIALVQVMLSLTDVSATPARGDALRERWLRQQGAEVDRRVRADDGAAPASPSMLGQALGAGGRLLGKGLGLMRDPVAASELARDGSAIAAELALAMSLPDDPPTLLKGELGRDKRCAWAEPIALDEVKAVGRALGCTVNDVVLAAAAGALRAHLLERGQRLDGVTVRATVPVNLRPLEHAKKLGNHFGLVFLDLPLGERNPVRRLQRIAASMATLKQSKQAVVTFGLLSVLGMAPSVLQRSALDMLSRKASMVATNVPGPQMPLYLAGERIAQMMFWVPQTGGIGLGISILSYDGRVQFGLMADQLRVPDPSDVVARFRSQFETLLYAVLLSDWQQPIDADACEAWLGEPHA